MANSDTYTERVAAAVGAAIEAAGTSANAVAKGTGIPQATLSRRLNGSPFHVGELDRIANYLGIQVEQFTAPARQDDAA
jgi:transcriptional regulator with XRE-family HTH domain